MTRWFSSNLKTRYSQIWKGSKTTTSEFQQHQKEQQQQEYSSIVGDRYKLLYEIGQGVSGTVYLAVDTKTDKQYCVKEINKSWLAKQHRLSLLYRSGPRSRKSNSATTPSTEETTLLGVAQTKKRKLNNSTAQLQQETSTCPEIDILKKLPAHKNIIRLIDVIREPSSSTDAIYYVVTEVAEKGSVMDITPHKKSKPYSESTCKLIFKQLVDAVAHLHENGMVHRDIKPQNMVQTKDNIVKLIDFGSAMKVTDCLYNQIGGSPAFMAPELIDRDFRNKRHSPFSIDIWAMGITLYCLVYGHLPFEQFNFLKLYHDIVTEDVKHDTSRVSSELCILIDKLLEKDPAKRITIEELKKHSWLQSK